MLKIKEKKSSIFTIFGLEPSTTIDMQKLETKYSELVKEHHPDTLMKKSVAEEKMAEEKMAMVNRAYKILSSPKLICQYLIDQMFKVQPAEELMGDYDMSDIMSLYDEFNDLKNLKDYDRFKSKISGLCYTALSSARQNIIDKNPKIAQMYMNKLNFLDNLLQKTRSQAFHLQSQNKAQGHSAPAA